MLKTMKKRLKNQRGLTLVELLAVIVILGIISAIAIPSIGGLIDKTKKDATVAEAIQIINAAKMYTTTNPKTGELTDTELGIYLDNVKDTDYTVIVGQSGDGKFTYSIKNHDASKAIGKDENSEISEEDLLKHTGAVDDTDAVDDNNGESQE